MILDTPKRRCGCAVVVVLCALSGCQTPRLPDWAVFDKIGPNDPVPAEIASRYGPTPAQRTEQIEQWHREARRASPQEQQRISDLLARQIQTEKDPEVRRHIIDAIAVCRTPIAAAVLGAGLEDEDTDVRVACCEAWKCMSMIAKVSRSPGRILIKCMRILPESNPKIS